MQMGVSEAAVLAQKVSSYGDPRLFVLAHVGSALSKSTQPLVPERVFLSSNGSNGHGEESNGSATPPAMSGLVGMILQSLLAERTSFADRTGSDLTELKALATQLTRDTLQNMQAQSGTVVAPVASDEPAVKQLAAK
jgi:hypothetical protein